MIRGIQIVGLVIALSILAFILYARSKDRLNNRGFSFWIIFWAIFIFIDLFPSIAAYVSPALTLESTMYVLTAGSVLTLFVLVFVMYSFLSDLNHKVNGLIREQAILGNKIAKLTGDKNQ